MGIEYILTSHGRERIRERLGIATDSAAVAWVREAVDNAKDSWKQGGKTVYLSKNYEIVLDGNKVVTVKPTDASNMYLGKIDALLKRHITKQLAQLEREFRKKEITVAEAQLNYLKARNPKTKEAIRLKLSEAVSEKAAVSGEIDSLKFAGRRHGVEV